MEYRIRWENKNFDDMGTLTDQFRNQLKSVCDWAQKYYCAQSECSPLRVTFVTYSKVFTDKLFDRLFAIYLLVRLVQESFLRSRGATERRTMKSKKSPNCGPQILDIFTKVVRSEMSSSSRIPSVTERKHLFREQLSLSLMTRDVHLKLWEGHFRNWAQTYCSGKK